MAVGGAAGAGEAKAAAAAAWESSRPVPPAVGAAGETPVGEVGQKSGQRWVVHQKGAVEVAGVAVQPAPARTQLRFAA